MHRFQWSKLWDKELDILETILNIPEAKWSKIETVKKKYTDFVKRWYHDSTTYRRPLVVKLRPFIKITIAIAIIIWITIFLS